MIIFFVNYDWPIEVAFYIDVDPNEIILSILEKSEKLKMKMRSWKSKYYEYKKWHNSEELYEDYLDKKEIIKGLSVRKTLKDYNIKEYALIQYKQYPYEVMGEL